MSPLQVLRVIINDALCDPPNQQSTVPHVLLLQHASLTLWGRKHGGVWDEAPYGTWQKTFLPPEGEVFRTDCQPTYHPHGPSWGIELLLAPAPNASKRALKRARMSVMDSWLQAAGPRKDCEHANDEE